MTYASNLAAPLTFSSSITSGPFTLPTSDVGWDCCWRTVSSVQQWLEPLLLAGHELVHQVHADHLPEAHRRAGVVGVELSRRQDPSSNTDSPRELSKNLSSWRGSRWGSLMNSSSWWGSQGVPSSPGPSRAEHNFLIVIGVSRRHGDVHFPYAEHSVCQSMRHNEL